MNEEKKYLNKLTISICCALNKFDEVMKEAESNKRGEKLAKICNFINIENDIAMHHGLDMSFRRINNRKRKLRGDCFYG